MASHSVVIDLDASLGASIIGVLLMCTLLGIVTTQTHTYFRTFAKDSTWLKTTVGVVFILEVGHSICVAHVSYRFVVAGYETPPPVESPPKTFAANIVMSHLIRFIVETYFAYRIWRLTSNKIIAGIAVILNTVVLAVGIVLATNSFILKSLPEFRVKMSWVIPTSIAVALAVDVYITTMLISWLARTRRTALRSTAKLLDRALLWAIQTGLVTCLNSVAMLTTFELLPMNFFWFASYIIHPNLYSNSLLVSLNARASYHQNSSIDIVLSDDNMIAGSYQTQAATANARGLEMHKLKGSDSARFAPTSSGPSIILDIRSQAKEGEQETK